MAAVESARGACESSDICESTRDFSVSHFSGGDYTKDLQTHITGTGIELMGAKTERLNAKVIATRGRFLGLNSLFLNYVYIEMDSHSNPTIMTYPRSE